MEYKVIKSRFCKLIQLLFKVENTIISLLRYTLFNYHSNNIRNAQRILLVRTSRLGDFIVAIPAMRYIKSIFPNAKLYLLTIDSTINKFSKKSTDPEWLKFVEDIFEEIYFVKGTQLIKKNNEVKKFIKNVNPDIVINIPFTGEGIKSKLKKILYFKLNGINKNVFGLSVFVDTNISKWINKQIYFCNNFLHQRIAPLIPLIEMGLIKEQDLKTFEKFLEEYKKLNIENSYKTNIRKNFLKKEDYIVIFPGGTFEHKIWPVDNFKDIINYILGKFPRMYIIIIGGKNDIQICNSLEKLVKNTRVVNMCGSLSLVETANLIKNSKMFIGNDSGPIHLASILNIPTIGIYSSIDFPEAWKPWSKISFYYRKDDLPCSLCFSFDNCPKGHKECINSIKVEDIIRGINKIIFKE